MIQTYGYSTRGIRLRRYYVFIGEEAFEAITTFEVDTETAK